MVVGMEWLNYHHLRYFWAIAHEGNLTKAAGKPDKDRLGLPAIPSPLLTLKPLPLTAIERAVTAFEAVLAINPLPAASSEPEAPFSAIWRVDCAPPSTRPTPVPPDKARLFGSVGS